jgi:hypothetical protein
MLWTAWWGQPARLGRPENARTEERHTVYCIIMYLLTRAPEILSDCVTAWPGSWKRLKKGPQAAEGLFLAPGGPLRIFSPTPHSKYAKTTYQLHWTAVSLNPSDAWDKMKTKQIRGFLGSFRWSMLLCDWGNKLIRFWVRGLLGARNAPLSFYTPPWLKFEEVGVQNHLQNFKTNNFQFSRFLCCFLSPLSSLLSPLLSCWHCITLSFPPIH